jgi:hypothetical protein
VVDTEAVMVAAEVVAATEVETVTEDTGKLKFSTLLPSNFLSSDFSKKYDK